MTYTKIPVSAERLVQTIREVADGDPERVYSAPEHMKDYPEDLSCFYVHTSDEGSEAGCIIGQALNRLGVPLEVLRAHERTGASTVISKVLELTGSFDAANRALTFAAYAQNLQDGTSGTKYPWRDAVQAAEFQSGLAVV